MPKASRRGTRSKSVQNVDLGSWSKLPYLCLVETYRHLSDTEKVTAAQVCPSWEKALRCPALWRRRRFEFGGPKMKASGQNAVQFAEKFGSYLRHVEIKCRHLTSNTCDTITSTLDLFATHMEHSTLEILEIKGIELDRFWKYSHLRLKVAECLIRLLRNQKRLQVLELSSAQFGLLPGVDVLQTVALASGSTLHTLNLEDFFHHHLAVFPWPDYITTAGMFTNLQNVILNYCCLSEDIVRLWANSLQQKLTHLWIKVCENEPHAHLVSNEAWTLLSTACPDLTVELVVHGVGPSSRVVPILTPAIPLVCLHYWSGYDNDTELQLNSTINHIAFHYAKSLKQLYLDFDNFHDTIDDALVALVSRCRHLTDIRLKARTSVQMANALCQMLREQRTNLTSIDITLCDMSEPDLDRLQQLREQMGPLVEATHINFVLRDELI